MYAFEQDVPIDAALHAQIVAALGDEPPQGLLAHIAIEREDGHLHYLDLWQTRADCEAEPSGPTAVCRTVRHVVKPLLTV